MNVSVYCPECKKTTSLDVDLDSKDEQPLNNTAGVPAVPGVKTNGLMQLSIVHDGHIVLMDIDQNGAARNVKTVSSIQLDSRLTSYTAMITDIILSRRKQSMSIIIHSDNGVWNNFYNYVISQLLFQSLKSDDAQFILEKCSSFKVLKVENFYYKLIKNLKNTDLGKPVGALIIEFQTIESLKRQINEYRKSINDKTLIAVAFTTQREMIDNSKEVNKILQGSKSESIQMLLANSAEKVGISMIQIFQNLLMN